MAMQVFMAPLPRPTRVIPEPPHPVETIERGAAGGPLRLDRARCNANMDGSRVLSRIDRTLAHAPRPRGEV
ncbi:hypothetical protein MTBSS4_40190 [Magnetospirillum sp. SS-4]|nr:hypothetical protein MTBSS4_40190 [Magnetospirillum sp. SS-4]